MSWILHWFIQSSLSRYANTWNVVITATKKHCITPWTAAKWTKTVFYPLFFISCGGTPTQRREKNFFAFRCSKNFSVERRPNVGRPVDFPTVQKRIEVYRGWIFLLSIQIGVYGIINLPRQEKAVSFAYAITLYPRWFMCGLPSEIRLLFRLKLTQCFDPSENTLFFDF